MLDNPKQFLSSLPNKPGVYEMYDKTHQVLYIGKAKNLKRRVSSYFREPKDAKTKVFMSQVKNIEIIITPNENAALLLESNLIKTKKPRYNVLFKDDKSFPYLVLSKHDFPRLEIYRGTLSKSRGKYFGPFPDVSAVYFIFNMIQKIFHLRVCKDSFMRNRSRPCVLHQIHLCSAPCVGYSDKEAYVLQVKLVEDFFDNKSGYVVQKLTSLMDEAAAKLAYEQAANYRDQISQIRKIQSKQIMTNVGGDCDVIAIVTQENRIGINLLFVRNGLVIGNKNYFPYTYNFTTSQAECLSAFIMHYYLQEKTHVFVPGKILLNIKLANRLNIAKIFHKKFGRRVVISEHIKGVQKQLITMAETNVFNALKTHYGFSPNYEEYLSDFKQTFHLSSLPKRIEGFDISHTMGEATIASCVVFNMHGPVKKEYRRFNIKNATVSDDYGALREVLLRRYRSLKNLPDVIIVDGGVGQLSIAAQVLKGLKIKNVMLLAVAKGEGRKPGLEKIYRYGIKDPLSLSFRSFSVYLLQQIRDEAHRFAVSGHRGRMRRLRQRSELESIIGIGKLKYMLLLKYFGGMDELRSVGIDDLIKVKGISHALAKRIYEHLHE